LKELKQILPEDSADFKYVIYPLQVGHCKLPSFHVKLNNYNYNLPSGSGGESLSPMSGSADSSMPVSMLDSVISNMLPTQLFVFPEKTEEASLAKLTLN
jgi:hypothetical protein